ncbi:MAG: hypothetical protein ABUL62_09875 [Myxococcales bacterium]
MPRPLNFPIASLLIAVFSTACGSSVELASDPNSQPPPPPEAQFKPSADPTTITEINERVGDLLVDEKRIYWAGMDGPYGNHWLRSCAKDDCANTVINYATAYFAQSFGVQSGQVYWLGSGGYPTCHIVLSCEIDGCNGAPREVGRPHTDASTPSGCAYATTFTSDAAYLCGEQMLEKIPLSGAGPQLRLAFPKSCSAVAVNGDFVYWLGLSDTADTSLALRRTPIDGSGSTQVLADNLRVTTNNYKYGMPEFQAQNIAFHSGFVYWSQGTLYGSIARCPLTGCLGEPEVVAQPLNTPTSLLIDGAVLYFQHGTINRGSAISRLTLPSGAPSDPLVFGVEAESALATDDLFLYTATSDAKLSADGVWLDPWASIRRIPKAGTQP